MFQDGVECLTEIGICGDLGRDPCSDVGFCRGMGLVMPALTLLANSPSTLGKPFGDTIEYMGGTIDCGIRWSVLSRLSIEEVGDVPPCGPQGSYPSRNSQDRSGGISQGDAVYAEA